MKRINSILGCIIIVLALQSCEKTFPLEVADGQMAHLTCLPGAMDTTIIRLSRAIPIGDRKTRSASVETANLRMVIDGSEVKSLQYADSALGCVPKGCWFVTRRFSQDEHVEIYATADELPSVYAETVIPKISGDISYALTHDVIEVGITGDNEAEPCSYGISLTCTTTVNHSDGTLTTKSYNMIPFKQESLLFGSNISNDFLDFQFNGWVVGQGRYIRVWSTNKKDSGAIQLSMRYRLPIMDYYNPEEATVSYSYKIMVYKFTRDFLRYVTALDNQDMNFLAEYGLAPGIFTYGNVSKGTGIVAGWTYVESDSINID